VCQAWWWDSSLDAIDAAAIAGKVWPGGIYCAPVAASPIIPVPVSALVLARLQARQLNLSICQGSSRGK